MTDTSFQMIQSFIKHGQFLTLFSLVLDKLIQSLFKYSFCFKKKEGKQVMILFTLCTKGHKITSSIQFEK